MYFYKVYYITQGLGTGRFLICAKTIRDAIDYACETLAKLHNDRVELPFHKSPEDTMQEIKTIEYGGELMNVDYECFK